MEQPPQQQQHSTYPSSPSSYATAPNSPNDLDEFEFGICKNQTGGNPKEHSEHGPGRVKYRDRGDSLPAMAFADELFFNGLVMPLKLPPRLQSDGGGLESNQRSPISSPRTACRLPFARRGSWNDEFDPFAAALEKVREDDRGRGHHHRRSRSYSPFRRNTIMCTNNNNRKPSDDDGDIGPSVEPLKAVEFPPSHSGPLDFKGSAYARWVRDQTRERTSPRTPRSFSLGKRITPVKEQDDPENRSSPKTGKSDTWKLKGFLQRYVSFGKKLNKTDIEAHKVSYFSKVGFKFKGSKRGGERKKMPGGDANMALVKYKPKPSSSFILCLGGGVRSPARAK